VLLATVVAAGPACMTTEEMAPPVTPELARLAAQQGITEPALQRGRVTYLTDCARCHSIEPIERYLAEEWRNIIPRMARESRLTESETAHLLDYVLTVTEHLDRQRALQREQLASANERRAEASTE
jgi:mono/diheme cytochrome c family protein